MWKDNNLFMDFLLIKKVCLYEFLYKKFVMCLCDLFVFFEMFNVVYDFSFSSGSICLVIDFNLFIGFKIFIVFKEVFDLF